jgi:hypothetical protein
MDMCAIKAYYIIIINSAKDGPKPG